jgi:hypothetical protein
VAAANATCTPQTRPTDSNFCEDKCGLFSLPDGCQGTFKIECPCKAAGDRAPTAAPTAAPVGFELPRDGGEFPVVPSGDSGKRSGSGDLGKQPVCSGCEAKLQTAIKPNPHLFKCLRILICAH